MGSMLPYIAAPWIRHGIGGEVTPTFDPRRCEKSWSSQDIPGAPPPSAS